MDVTFAHHHRRKCRFEDRKINQPIHVRVDVEAHAAWARYAPGPLVSTVDADGTSVGIEVLEIQLSEQIAIARKFADEQAFAFPRDLAGNLVAA